jgi:hypothetical protein
MFDATPTGVVIDREGCDLTASGIGLTRT